MNRLFRWAGRMTVKHSPFTSRDFTLAGAAVADLDHEKKLQRVAGRLSAMTARFNRGAMPVEIYFERLDRTTGKSPTLSGHFFFPTHAGKEIDFTINLNKVSKKLGQHVDLRFADIDGTLRFRLPRNISDCEHWKATIGGRNHSLPGILHRHMTALRQSSPVRTVKRRAAALETLGS